MPDICPICSCASVRTLRRDVSNADNNFVSCEKCGHSFCSKPPYDGLENSPEKFNQKAFFGEEGAPLPEWGKMIDVEYENYAEGICRIFRKYAPGKNFLEIGCGTGSFLRCLARRSDFVLHGNDISPKAAGIVREALGIPVTGQSFAKELYLPQKFDMVFAAHVIEHIVDAYAFISDIRAVCNPGAIVGIVCPNQKSLTSLLKMKFLYPRKTHEYGHLHWPAHIHGYSPRSLRYLMKNSGFIPVKTELWNKAQKKYPYNPKLSDRIFYPVYIAEFLFGRGNIIVDFYRKTTGS